MSAVSPSLLPALVGALLPEGPPLDAAARATVEGEVVEFVQAEIDLLPAHLRWPYRVALRAFDWSAVVLHGRPFHALGLEARRRFLAAWGDGRLELARDFVKLVRVCALLQYYDHPLVLAASAERRRS